MAGRRHGVRPRRLSAFASSATGAPVTDEHDFTGGDAQGWFSYANAGTVSSNAATGELCAQVDGGANPWDIALQHDGVTYERDLTYTVAFDAHATAAVTVQLQGGPDYPAAFGHPVVLDGTATPQHVEFTFSPADWPTAPGEPSSPVGADWTTTTGRTSFQLGGQPAAYTFCVDNFSMTSDSGTPGPGTPGTVVDHDFADGDLGGFNLYDSAGGGTARAGADGLSACIDLQGGYANPYEAGLEYPHIDIVEGTNYVLAFTAYASSAANINVLVGQYGDPAPGARHRCRPDVHPDDVHVPVHGRRVLQLGPRDRIRAHPARARPPGVGVHVLHHGPVPRRDDGGAPAVRARHRPRVRVNQVGYLPKGPSTRPSSRPRPTPSRGNSCGQHLGGVRHHHPARGGPAAGQNVHTSTSPGHAAAGTGYTLVADGETSHPFDISARLYQQLRSDALQFFYIQRSGIAIDGDLVGAQYARPAGHLGVAPNKGDTDVPCQPGVCATTGWTSAAAGTTPATTASTWSTAASPAYQLLSTYERTKTRRTAGTAPRSATARCACPSAATSVPDILDEARWELEFLLRMQVPAGKPLAGMAHHKMHDANWTGLPLRRRTTRSRASCTRRRPRPR